MNERHRKKSDNADIILEKKEKLQYKSEQLVRTYKSLQVRYPPDRETETYLTQQRERVGGLKTKKNPIRQPSLLLLFVSDKGHVSAPGFAEGYKATAVLSSFPQTSQLIFTCLFSMLHGTPLGL